MSSFSLPDRIDGKIALITGASRGIGSSIAVTLAEAGADIIVNYCKSEAKADAVVEEVRQMGRKAVKVNFDVSNFEEVEAAVNHIGAAFRRIDILVNNAGINRDHTFVKMSKEEWNEVISVNLNGVFNVTKAVLPFMLSAGWGRIINISSIVGISGNFGQTNYVASKAALIGLSKALAMELAKDKITVNVVAPGFTTTEMVESLPVQVKDNLYQKILLKRFAQPCEVGRMVAFLASPRSDYITGGVFAITGGYQGTV
jgi:3-oxoacyl-[acyl-carrier protein] reductase